MVKGDQLLKEHEGEDSVGGDFGESRYEAVPQRQGTLILDDIQEN